jgi:dimethylargininase
MVNAADPTSLNPRFTRAITRRPARTLARGEISAAAARLGEPDHALALQQFEAYVAALRDCGLVCTILGPLDNHPDAHFVEDAAVVTAEVAVVTRPGAPSRLGEQQYMEPEIAQHRPIVRIEEPGTLDGGDVLQIGREVLIGLSDRTDAEGARQLGHVLEARGYRCRTIEVEAGLHLKSSVNHVGSGTLLVTAAFAGHPGLREYDQLVVPEGEEYACNTLLVNDRLLVPAGFAGTRELLGATGLPILVLDTSEFRKMDGGLTCLSLRF